MVKLTIEVHDSVIGKCVCFRLLSHVLGMTTTQCIHYPGDVDRERWEETTRKMLSDGVIGQARRLCLDDETISPIIDKGIALCLDIRGYSQSMIDSIIKKGYKK